MVAAYQSSSTTNNGPAGASTMVLTKPASVASGDLLFAAIHSQFTGVAYTLPTGWVMVTQTSNPANAVTVSTFVKVAGGAEPASYTFTPTGVNAYTGVILRYTGAAAATPVDVSGGGSADTGTTLTAPAVTTTVGGDLLLFVYGTWVATTLTTGSSQTQRVNFGSNNNIVAVSDAAATGTGLQSARTDTQSPTGQWVAATIAIKPTAGSTIHTVTGDGSFSIATPAGVLVSVANIPPAVNWSKIGNPKRYYGMGDIAFATANGPFKNVPLLHTPLVVAAPAANCVTLHYSIPAGATATITELATL